MKLNRCATCGKEGRHIIYLDHAKTKRRVSWCSERCLLKFMGIAMVGENRERV